MIRAALVTTALAAALVAGCGGDDEEEPAAPAAQAPAASATAAPADTPEPEPTATAAPKRRGTTVKVVSSEFGDILADGKGIAFYYFDKEKSSKSECYGDCATAWPPVLTKGEPVAGEGAEAKLIGTTRRSDGKLQVTYDGRPVYYYVHDAPGRVLCHNVEEFGGLWVVIKPDGTPVG